MKATKEILHFDPEVDFRSRKTRSTTPARSPSAASRCTRSGRPFAEWAKANPEAKALFDRMAARRLPDGWTEALPESRPTPRA